MDDEIVRWITWRGKHIPIGKDGKIIKKNDDIKKETFDLIDADNPQEFKQKRKEYVDKNMELGEIISKDKARGRIRGRIKALLDKKIVGTLDYKIEKNKINVIYIHVNDDYRRSGIATKMYKELQSKTPNTDIIFGEFTDEGRKLVEKIGNITKKETMKDGFTKYYGRIK